MRVFKNVGVYLNYYNNKESRLERLCMVYFAHPNEPLEEHLLLTALLCERYGAEINSASIAKALGLLHDIGKHTKRFQDVLKGNESKIDHAIVAAEMLFYYSCIKKIANNTDNKYLISVMQHILAGHHSEFGLTAEEKAGSISNKCRNRYEMNKYLVNNSEATQDNGKKNAIATVEEAEEIANWIQDSFFDVEIDFEQLNAFFMPGRCGLYCYVYV